MRRRKKPPASNGVKTTVIRARVSPEQKAALEAYAKQRHLSLSALVREILLTVAAEGSYPPPPRKPS